MWYVIQVPCLVGSAHLDCLVSRGMCPFGLPGFRGDPGDDGPRGKKFKRLIQG